MSIFRIFLLFAMFPVSQVWAEVTVMQIPISRAALPVGTNSYTVAAGHSLYIEHVYVQNTADYVYFAQGFSHSGGIVVPLRQDKNLVSFSPALKIKAGYTLSANNGAIVVFGLLVGDDDVYAAIPSKIDAVQAANPLLHQGELSLSSPRPALVSLERSTDLEAWAPADDARVQPGSDPGGYTFDVPTAEDATFYRSKARARN